MDKFSVFDQILDSVFVVDSAAQVCYANLPAAELVGLSQKRLIGKKALHELFSLELFPFPFNEESAGWSGPSPYLETNLESIDGKGRSCKVQLAVTPWSETEGGKPLWVFILKDVTLEEALHSKYKSELEQKEGYIEELKKAHDHLEELVEQRTLQLKSANLTLKAIIDSLGQGFLTFDRSGQCGDIFTKACEVLLEANPSGKSIKEVLKIQPEKDREFSMWSSTVFDELLPFDDMKGLGPDQYSHSQDRSVFLEYFPIRDEGQKIEKVVLVATDKTDEIEARKKLAEEHQFVEMVLKFVKSKKKFLEFLKTIPGTLESSLRMNLSDPEMEKEAFRTLHTLEGESGTFSLHGIRMASKGPQKVLQEKKGDWKKEFVQAVQLVEQKYQFTLNQIQEAFGPVLSENADLIEISKDALSKIGEKIKGLPKADGVYAEIVALLSHRTIESALVHYDGLVQSVCEKLGKKALPIKFVGADQPLPIDDLKPLFSSFVHLFRNSLDHGIESPEDRAFSGKPEQGLLTIQCEVDDARLKLRISDDGRGISAETIRKKLQEKYPDQDFSKQSNEDVIQGIFLPGFSSRDAVTEFSGRGVGMDAVREEVERLGGAIRVYSNEGQGTEFVMEVPMKSWLNKDLKRAS